jgi:hypothetical protein
MSAPKIEPSFTGKSGPGLLVRAALLLACGGLCAGCVIARRKTGG